MGVAFYLFGFFVTANALDLADREIVIGLYRWPDWRGNHVARRDDAGTGPACAVLHQPFRLLAESNVARKSEATCGGAAYSPDIASLIRAMNRTDSADGTRPPQYRPHVPDVPRI